MSKKGTIEVFQTKISRNDRFAQMSHQEKLIEQKKREIQAKLEQKRATKDTETTKAAHKSVTAHKCHVKTVEKEKCDKKAFNFNTFSNDGSFLNQFKQLKEKKLDHKIKFSKQGSDRDCDRNERNKSKWKKDTSSSPPSKDTLRGSSLKPKQSRFTTEKVMSAFDASVNLNANFNFTTQPPLQLQQQTFEPAVITAQDVTGQPLLKNLVTPPPPPPHVPLMMNVPPPQLQLIAPELTVEMCAPSAVITTVALPVTDTTMISVPPPCLPPLELANIPPPNPLQIHNIPQPEPINTLTIPPPAPLQVQNIPPPSPIQLNEIPNPKPLDLLNIPTPNEEPNADFIKNVPPPNKSVPPPTHLTVPQSSDNQVAPTCIPPPNIMPPTSMPPPPTTGVAGLNLLVAQVPPVQVQLQQLPPPPTIVTTIPSLMAQPIMPPPSAPVPVPTMGIVPPPQINVPPPTMIQPTPMALPPPIYNAPTIIPVNVPPPQMGCQSIQKDVSPGCAGDYEAMASLGRMVAQCGPGIEDVVRQRKNQDPSLWFLFDKSSPAYRQYQQLVEQFKAEMSGGGGGGGAGMPAQQSQRSDAEDYKPEEIYESDAGCDDGDMNPGHDGAGDLNMAAFSNNKRKRKSRWGEKVGLAPATVVQTIPAPILPPSSTGVMLSKLTRQDPGFLAYIRSTYGGANLNEETWKKAEDNYKVHLVYQEMLKKKQDLESLQRAGRNKYEYDSDEEIDGGTWEHKQREKEMQTTQSWAQDLTRQADGKHHIGDFLPPEEFRKLLAKNSGDVSADASDYFEHKLGEDNKGFKMLQKLGWSEGKGLGSTEKGILEPINKGFVSRDGQGLGNQADVVDENDGAEDEYDAYRKRMMLAYKFRPNPLNNPRRAYY